MQAQFVASRTKLELTKDLLSTGSKEAEVLKPSAASAAASEDTRLKKLHTPLPKAMEDTTQPIMYIDKKTGLLQVDMMWTCTKCSFAYNKVEDAKCEVCSVQRPSTKSEHVEKLEKVIQVKIFFL